MDITSRFNIYLKIYIWLTLNLIQSIIFKNPTNIEEVEHMEYICHKIMPIAKFEKLHIYFKIRVVGGIIRWIFSWCMILIYIN